MNFKSFAVLLLATLASTSAAETQEPADKLSITVTHEVEGCTVRTQPGDIIKVHYRGSLASGVEFDSSYSRDQPIQFTLGVGQVIKGWDEGLLEMCVNEQRSLVIPPSMGYGESGAGNVIPPNATLFFFAELVEIIPRKDEL